MDRRGLAAVAALGMIGAASLALAQTEPRGYLSPGAFDILAVLPPAPEAGDARDQADRVIFKATRKLVGTPRWDLATNDVKLAPADIMRDFSCAVGVDLIQENAPRTAAMMRAASFDTAKGSSIAKNYYKRPRPYLVDQGAICQPASELANSADYSSGHTTIG